MTGVSVNPYGLARLVRSSSVTPSSGRLVISTIFFLQGTSCSQRKKVEVVICKKTKKNNNI